MGRRVFAVSAVHLFLLFPLVFLILPSILRFHFYFIWPFLRSTLLPRLVVVVVLWLLLLVLVLVLSCVSAVIFTIFYGAIESCT